MKYVGENALKKLISLVKSDIKKKLDKNQGTANSGKILGVDASGEVAPTDTEVVTLVDVPNGIVKGDGSTLSAAVAGTDYMAPPTGGTAGQVLKKTETGTEWADESGGSLSTAQTITLLTSGWVQSGSIYVQTVSVDGVTTTSNGSLRIAQSATDEQFAAWRAAKPRVTAQADGMLAVKAVGTVPTIDIPVEVLIV